MRTNTLGVVRMKTLPELEPMLDIKDVAKMLRLSERFLYEEARLGHLKSVKVGGKLRFRRADVEAYIQAHLRNGNKE